MAEGNPRGKPASWVAVTLMVLGFVIGGVGLVIGNWVLFWVGGGIVLVGGIVGLATGILDDVH
jgi:hypothetical protein